MVTFVILFLIGCLLGLSFLWLKAYQDLKTVQKKLEDQKNKTIQAEQESSIKETKISLLEASLKKGEEQLKTFEKQLVLQFENLSQKIFSEKTSQFKKDSSEQIGHLLNPFKEKLSQFQEKVETYYKTESNERFSLKSEIEKLILTGNKVQEETQKLSQAIQGDIQYQGNWGELVLNRILEKSGLRENQEFFLQGQGVGLKSDGGGILKPDVMVKLPKNRWLIIDSKVSLTHYLQYCDETLTEEKQKLIKSFTRSVKSHIKNLSSKNYQDALEKSFVDFVFLFFPHEAAFSMALKEEPLLLENALEEKIIMVSPSTLITALKTVYFIWQKEKERKNVFEISKAAGGLYDKFVGFMDDFQKIKQNLEKSSQSYEFAFNKLKSGKGNIISKLEHIKELGAQSKKNLSGHLIQNPAQTSSSGTSGSDPSFSISESKSSRSQTSSVEKSLEKSLE